MLPTATIQARKPASVTFNAGLAGLTNVLLRLYRDGVEIGDSPIICSEHPVLAGVYVANVIIEETGSLLGKWHHPDFVVQAQNIVVVLATYSTLVRVWDSTTRERHADVRVMFLESVGTGRQLVSETTTDGEGECSVELPHGNFVIALTKTKTVFSRNAFELPISFTTEEAPCLLDTKAVAVPDSGYTPPIGLVTMTASLIGATGAPLMFRNIVTTVLSPAPYSSSGEKYVVAEDRVVEMTDANGQASVSLVPGSTVEVAVENTLTARRFVVPSDDFDLFDNLGASDYFGVQDPAINPIEKES